jgi:proline iminopeptidase
VKRVGLVLGLLGLLGVALGSIALGGVALLAVASLTDAPALFVSAGVVTGLGAWIVLARLLVRGHRPRTARLLMIGGALVVGSFFAAALVPLGDAPIAPESPPGAGAWAVSPDARLAYGVVRAPTEELATPVIALHGGPGVPDSTNLLAALGPLSAAGHDVWAYDQMGTGRSTRLGDPREYTTARSVADLERVRQLIGAETVILVGHSYGAYLAAAYIARHPGRVERVVFLSPGPMEANGLGGRPQLRLSAAQSWDLYRLLISPRALIAYGLVQVNPQAAHAFAGDREVDARQDRVYARTLPALHCPGRTGPELHGNGFYAATVPQSARAPAEPGIRSELAASLAESPVPALVIKGQCDYLSWEAGTSYIDAFPGGQLVYLPGAGHDVHVDDPGAVRAAIAAFLAGAPIAGAARDPHEMPAGYQP